MIEPKKQVFEKLSEIANVSVYQARPSVIESFPTINFKVSLNSPEYGFDKKTYHQNMIVEVEIWGVDSASTTNLLIEVERKMTEIDFLLASSIDVPEDDGYSHLVLEFNY
jgi:hypothetical protein